MNHLVSFADTRLKGSHVRLLKQAKEMNFFDKIHLFDENDLSVEFRKKFKDKLVPGSRGFGYWSWKPEVILNVLNKIEEGDCLLYLDAGCHLNVYGKKRLVEYFNILKSNNKGIIAFQTILPNNENSSLEWDGRELLNWPISNWTKGDLLDYFCFRDNQSVINTQCIVSTLILIKKCKTALGIIEQWQNIIIERFDLLDDTPSLTPNLTGYIEHRHDQAIWSLICVKNEIKTLSHFEQWYPKPGSEVPDWKALHGFPIHAKRDKDRGILLNFLRRFLIIIMLICRVRTRSFRNSKGKFF
jgi:hypothetical protein